MKRAAGCNMNCRPRCQVLPLARLRGRLGARRDRHNREQAEQQRPEIPR